MDPEQLKALTDMIEALRADINAAVSKVDAKCDALADSVATMKKTADEAGERSNENEYDLARRAAADSASRSDLAMLQRQVNELTIKALPRPAGDADALADIQAKCDAAYIANGGRADPPMRGEGVIDYAVRMHRGLQSHGKKWKGAELAVIARDSTTFAGVCDAIRADAVKAGLNPVDLKPLEHRMFTETMPSGHVMRRFVGNGTIFKQMSLPVRHVQRIGPRWDGAGA
jgi:hypothetical protein